MSKDGGPAFPEVSSTVDRGGQMMAVQSTGGMSLRDYFAAKALEGQISNINTTGAQIALLLPSIAIVAYAAADAMLKAREQ